MFSALGRRLSYIRLLFRRSTWRWLLDRIDYQVLDHVEPMAKLQGARGFVHPTVSFRCPENIFLGEKTRIQNNAILWASPNSRIVVGDFTGIGPGAMVFSSNHKFAPGVPYVEQEWNEADVIIGSDVWIGAGVTIVAGVTIGDGSVVAAGSVVTKSIGKGVVAAGVPAKVIHQRATDATD